MPEAEYRTQHVAAAPSGYHVRTIPSGEHWIRLAFPPGPRRRGSGRLVEILHPAGENPCRLNPAELVVLGNPHEIVQKGTRAVMIYSNDADGPFHSRLWVNAKVSGNQIVDGDATTTSRTATTLAGARKQAEKMLADASRNPAELVILGNPSQAGKDAYQTGYDHGYYDASVGHKSEYSFHAYPSESQYQKDYSRGYRAGHSAYHREHRSNPSVVQQHLIKIAKDTLRMPDAMLGVMGGMTKEQAREILRKHGIRFKENPGDETNETDQAVRLYQEFHGKDPQGIIEAQRSAAMRTDYACLGPLLGVAPFVEGLKIPSPEHWDDGGYPVLTFSGVKLASNAEGTQLYAIGGDQDLTEVLDQFPEVDAAKDLIDLGPIAYITYEARKSMDGFELVQYTHTFDEPRPLLGYDQVKREIFFVGGRYQVNAPGIEN